MIKVDTNELFFGLGFMRDIIENNPHMAILGYVKIECKAYEITLWGKSEDKVGKCTVPTLSLNEDITVVVHFENLYKIVSAYRQAGSEEIHLDFKSRVVNVCDHHGKSPVPLGTLEHYPDIQIPTGTVINVSPKEIISLLGLSAFADSSLTVLNTVHIRSVDGLLTMEATDGACGGYGAMDVSHKDNFDIAVPPSGLARILQKMERVTTEEETWKLIITDRSVYFIGEYWFVGFQLLNGNYPSLNGVYSNDNINGIELDTTDLKNKLNIIRASDSDNVVLLEIKDGRVILSSTSDFGGKHTLDITLSTPNNSILLNLHNFHKVVSQIKNDVITMQLGHSLQPVLVAEEDRIYFLIPTQN